MKRPVLLCDLDNVVYWAAGLFEGEGSVCISRPYNRMINPQLSLQLSMTDFDVVEAFAEWAKAGYTHEVSPRQDHHLPQLRWFCSDALETILLIGKLMPYMGERKFNKMNEVLEVAASFEVTPGRWAERQRLIVDEATRLLGGDYDHE